VRFTLVKTMDEVLSLALTRDPFGAKWEGEAPPGEELAGEGVEEAETGAPGERAAVKKASRDAPDGSGPARPTPVQSTLLGYPEVWMRRTTQQTYYVPVAVAEPW